MISRSRAFSSPKPKRTNLAQTGINAYDTAGNQRVKLANITYFKFVILLRNLLPRMEVFGIG